MKIFRLVLITSMLMTLAHLAKAQVKIGDDPLEIAADRQFEIQQNDTLFVITDNLTLGRTINQTANTLADALMIKLLGYGIDQFGPLLGVRDQHAIASGGTMSNVFLGITSDGQVLETPLRLLLDVDTSNAYISLFNEVDTFGTVDLAALDSIFVTDNELIDSLNTIRTLINNSNDADNDTITGNEYIDTILVVGDTLLRFIENQDAALGITNTQEVDLSPIIAAQTFYRADGTLDEDRTVDGDGNTLTFNNISNFNVTTTTGGVDIVADTTDVDGNLTFQDYGADGIKGTVTTILAFDANGNVIETTADEILSTQVDSTIYNNDGTLTGPRVLTGNSEDLTFTGLGGFTMSGTSSTSTTTGNTNINADSTFISEEVQLSNYGTDVSGAYLNVLGVDSLGNVVDVNIQDLLADGVDSTMYTHDGTLTGPRILTGNSEDLTFTGLGGFTVSGTSSTSTTTGNTNINADSTFISEEVQLSNYGTDVSGAYLNVLGVDSLGNVVDVNIQDLLADGVDSTMYTHDGTLTGPRVLTGNSEDLTFTGLGGFTVSGTSSTSTTTGNTNINADSTFISEELQLSNYGTDVSGAYLNVLGVDSLGNVVDVNVQDLLADGVDSTIYTHDGTLTAERYMTMDGKSLHFIDGSDTTVITNDGRMAIGKGSVMQGTLTPNDVRLEVNGDILAIQVHSSSDRRFKKNINPVENALQKVLGIEGVTYDFRTEEFLNRNFPSSKQLGFIAQDIETQLPEVVRTNPDGYKAVDYAKVTALLVEAMKEQQAIIDGLQNKMELSASLNAQLYQEIQSIKRSNKDASNLDLADED